MLDEPQVQVQKLHLSTHVVKGSTASGVAGRTVSRPSPVNISTPIRAAEMSRAQQEDNRRPRRVPPHEYNVSSDKEPATQTTTFLARLTKEWGPRFD